MPQSVSQVILHMTFSTRKRVKCIHSPVKEDLHAYMAQTLRNKGSEAYRVGGTADHAHVACTLPATVAAADLVRTVKANSSKWIKDQGASYDGFQWQKGYAVFSVSKSRLPVLLDYIDSQESHHAETTFEDELRDFLNKCDIDFDEEYIWG
ncbi:MAG: IS200/IS605 family transposase [Candidatus Brocadiia bacterium]